MAQYFKGNKALMATVALYASRRVVVFTTKLPLQIVKMDQQLTTECEADLAGMLMLAAIQKCCGSRAKAAEMAEEYMLLIALQEHMHTISPCTLVVRCWSSSVAVISHYLLPSVAVGPVPACSPSLLCKVCELEPTVACARCGVSYGCAKCDHPVQICAMHVKRLVQALGRVEFGSGYLIPSDEKAGSASQEGPKAL